MQVSGVVALQYKDGPQIFIPSTLLQTDSDGQRWLKLRASSVTIAKLVLGHMEKFKKATDGLSSCFFTMVTMGSCQAESWGFTWYCSDRSSWVSLMAKLEPNQRMPPCWDRLNRLVGVVSVGDAPSVRNMNQTHYLVYPMRDRLMNREYCVHLAYHYGTHVMIEYYVHSICT